MREMTRYVQGNDIRHGTALTGAIERLIADGHEDKNADAIALVGEDGGAVHRRVSRPRASH